MIHIHIRGFRVRLEQSALVSGLEMFDYISPLRVPLGLLPVTIIEGLIGWFMMTFPQGKRMESQAGSLKQFLGLAVIPCRRDNKRRKRP